MQELVKSKRLIESMCDNEKKTAGIDPAFFFAVSRFYFNLIFFQKCGIVVVDGS